MWTSDDAQKVAILDDKSEVVEVRPSSRCGGLHFFY